MKNTYISWKSDVSISWLKIDYVECQLLLFMIEERTQMRPYDGRLFIGTGDREAFSEDLITEQAEWKLFLS